MRKGKSFLYALIPIFYVFVIGLFLYLQLSATRSISERIGAIELSGTAVPKTPWSRSEIADLQIGYQGIVFQFSDAQPLILNRQSGPTQKLAVLSYEVYPRGLELVLERGVKVSFELADALGQILTIAIVLDDAAGCLLPISVPDGRVEEDKGIPLILLKNRAGDFYLSLPATAKPNFEAGHIAITAAAGVQEIKIARAEESTGNLYLHWFSKSDVLRNDKEYELGYYNNSS